MGIMVGYDLIFLCFYGLKRDITYKANSELVQATNNQSKDGIVDIGGWWQMLSINRMEHHHTQSLLSIHLIDSKRKYPKKGHIGLGTHDSHWDEIGDQAHNQ